MSKSKAELSVSARLLLDYIVFRRKLNHTFFENNETIGFKLDLTEGTIKELVNRLVRMGYLVKGKDKYGRRVLETTALKHKPLFYPLQEINKRGLKEELDYQTKELEKAENLLKDYEGVIETLRNRCYAEEKKVKELQQQLAYLQGKLNPSQESSAPQHCDATPIVEQYSNNSESPVMMLDVNNVGNAPNSNDYQSVDDNTSNNPNQVDAKTMIDNLMRKIAPERFENIN